MKQLEINTKENHCKVVITDSFDEFECLEIDNKVTCVIISDDIVGKLYIQELSDKLKTIYKNVEKYIIPHGEIGKNIKYINEIYSFLLEKNIGREDYLIALGGGVVGDVVGFVASTYMRGIGLIHVPTTLLAQLDSSIGGKNAVNYNNTKNVMGTIYHPKFVYSNISVLKTLPKREIKAALAEVIVHALIDDPALLNYMVEHLNDIFELNNNVLEILIFWNCVIKIKIILEDEKDIGIRKKLNLGHTVGHAIEGIYHEKYKHGECVAIGVMFAFFIAREYKLISLEEVNYIIKILANLEFPIFDIELDWEKIEKNMIHDKKANHDKVSFILPISIGKVVEKDIAFELLRLCKYKKYVKSNKETMGKIKESVK